MTTPQLQYTKEYDRFEMHDYNRPLKHDGVLEQSMIRKGFMPSSPLQVIKNSNGKLKIIKGHRRFEIAKRLNLGIWYIIDKSNIDIFELEAGQSKWTISDFVHARAEAGDEDCIKLLDFWKTHKLPMGAAAALIGGESAGSGNKQKDIKRGKFHVGDLRHANQVIKITDRCRELNIPCAVSSGFVRAISSALRIPEFNADLFMHRIELNGSQMQKRGTANEYLDEIEALYNYGAHKTRLPVAFRAKEISKKRQKTFGKKS